MYLALVLVLLAVQAFTTKSSDPSLARRHPFVCPIGVSIAPWLPIVVVAVNSLNADSYLIEGGQTPAGSVRPPQTAGQIGCRPHLRSLWPRRCCRTSSRDCVLCGAQGPRRATGVQRPSHVRLVLPEVVLATSLFLVLTRLEFQPAW
jgi:hypothetical protein